MLLNKWRLCSLCLFCLGVTAQATDLTITDIKTESYVIAKQPIFIQFTCANIDMNTESGQAYTISVKDQEGQIVFMEERFGPPVDGFTEQVISTLSPWTPEQTGLYTIDVRVDLDVDVDTTNNSLSQNTTAIISRDRAVELALNMGMEVACDTIHGAGFMPLSPLVPGDVVTNDSLLDETNIDITLDAFIWFAFYDCDQLAQYAHPTHYVLIDGVDSSTQVYHAHSPAFINQKSYMMDLAARDTSAERFTGSNIPRDTVESASTIHDGSGTPSSGPVTCAILAGGKDYHQFDGEAFKNDLDIMKQNLVKESLGMKLDSNKIKSLENASMKEISDAIDSVSTGYDKILFYYGGHGSRIVGTTDSYGYMCTNDSVYAQNDYETLASKLAKTKAKDICVIIDCCFSGQAIKAFKKIFGEYYTDKNVTLITATSKDTVGYYGYVHEAPSGKQYHFSLFSWYFLKCYGEPGANLDGDPNISFAEAFNWVYRMNPEIRGRGKMNEIMQPQMLVIRAEPAAPPPTTTRLPDTDCSFKMNTGVDAVDSTKVLMQVNQDSVFTWNDDCIFDLSGARIWTFDWLPQTSFNMDLEFTYRPELDGLNTSDSTTIGVVELNADGKWYCIPSEYQPDSNRVILHGVDTLGTYTLAELEPTSHTHDLNAVQGARMLIAPNPACDLTTIQLTLEHSAMVRIFVYDLMGHLMEKVVDSDLPDGTYTFDTDMKSWPAGTYRCVAYINNGILSKQVIKVDSK